MLQIVADGFEEHVRRLLHAVESADSEYSGGTAWPVMASRSSNQRWRSYSCRRDVPLGPWATTPDQNPPAMAATATSHLIGLPSKSNVCDSRTARRTRRRRCVQPLVRHVRHRPLPGLAGLSIEPGSDCRRAQCTVAAGFREELRTEVRRQRRHPVVAPRRR